MSVFNDRGCRFSVIAHRRISTIGSGGGGESAVAFDSQFLNIRGATLQSRQGSTVASTTIAKHREPSGRAFAPDETKISSVSCFEASQDNVVTPPMNHGRPARSAVCGRGSCQADAADSVRSKSRLRPLADHSISGPHAVLDNHGDERSQLSSLRQHSRPAIESIGPSCTHVNRRLLRPTPVTNKAYASRHP